MPRNENYDTSNIGALAIRIDCKEAVSNFQPLNYNDSSTLDSPCNINHNHLLDHNIYLKTALNDKQSKVT